MIDGTKGESRHTTNMKGYILAVKEVDFGGERWSATGAVRWFV